jgi:hypothetical protein
VETFLPDHTTLWKHFTRSNYPVETFLPDHTILWTLTEGVNPSRVDLGKSEKKNNCNNPIFMLHLC